MVGTSKILTVSYGTFSCTLEGFDDSFNTMKAIAEYFRGLAADDRYFGAEPPTPDAEMLASIAEREISRRVEAHTDESGIHLRAAALTDQSKADQSAADEAAKAEADAKAARKAEKAAAKAERKAAKAAEKAAAEAKAAEEAEKAEQARRAQAEADKAEEEARAAAEAEAEAEARAAAEAEAEAEAEADSADDLSILDSVNAATAEETDGAPGSDVEETRDDAPSSMLAATDPAPEDTQPKSEAVPAHPDENSVAAKLQRIRAVVGDSDNDPSNDLTEQFLPQAEEPAAAEEDDDAPQTGGSDMISRVMSRHSEGDDSAEDAETDADDEDTVSPTRARVVRMKRADFEKAMADQQNSAASEDTPREVAPINGPDLGLLDGADDLDEYLEDSDFVETGFGLGDTSEIDADLANDLKAIRGDLDDVAETDVDADESAETDDAVSNAVLGVLSEQDATEDQPVEAEEQAAGDEAAEEDAPENAFLAEEPQVDDEALDRLMSETDAQMQEPEGSRRRDAISQLKAAVAAKEAARLVGETDDDDQDVENAFRNDLSEVVRPEGGMRPRPVVREQSRTERPRPAPLKLVAAQRVDLPQAEPRDGPVIPRRVAARKDEAAQKAAGSFAEFAENMGASELPDLLEAAAAYTSFVEGADEFSRPQILRRVRTVASEDFNREDGLRSFADLLKAGRFTKVRNGRFQVADDSRYNPEQRAS